MYSCNADPAAVAADQVNKEEIDSRSVFVGNVSALSWVAFL